MRGAPLLLALATLAAGGCGQKGPLYLPDKVGKVVTSAPATPKAAPPEPPPPATPASAPPPGAAPAVPAKPTDRDQEQDSQPPK